MSPQHKYQLEKLMLLALWIAYEFNQNSPENKVEITITDLEELTFRVDNDEMEHVIVIVEIENQESKKFLSREANKIYMGYTGKTLVAYDELEAVKEVRENESVNV